MTLSCIVRCFIWSPNRNKVKKRSAALVNANCSDSCCSLTMGSVIESEWEILRLILNDIQYNSTTSSVILLNYVTDSTYSTGQCGTLFDAWPQNISSINKGIDNKKQELFPRPVLTQLKFGSSFVLLFLFSSHSYIFVTPCKLLLTSWLVSETANMSYFKSLNLCCTGTLKSDNCSYKWWYTADLVGYLAVKAFLPDTDNVRTTLHAVIHSGSDSPGIMLHMTRHAPLIVLT